MSTCRGTKWLFGYKKCLAARSQKQRNVSRQVVRKLKKKDFEVKKCHFWDRYWRASSVLVQSSSAHRLVRACSGSLVRGATGPLCIAGHWPSLYCRRLLQTPETQRYKCMIQMAARAKRSQASAYSRQNRVDSKVMIKLSLTISFQLTQPVFLVY